MCIYLAKYENYIFVMTSIFEDFVGGFVHFYNNIIRKANELVKHVRIKLS